MRQYPYQSLQIPIYTPTYGPQIGNRLAISLGKLIIEKAIEDRLRKRKAEQQETLKDQITKDLDNTARIIEKINKSVESLKQYERNDILQRKFQQKVQQLSNIEEGIAKLQILKRNLVPLSTQRAYSKSVEPLDRFIGKRNYDAQINPYSEVPNEEFNSKTDRIINSHKARENSMTYRYQNPQLSLDFTRMPSQINEGGVFNHSPWERRQKQTKYPNPHYLGNSSNLPISMHLQQLRHQQHISLARKKDFTKLRHSPKMSISPNNYSYR